MPSKKKAVGTPKKDDDASPLRHRIEKAVGTPKKDDDASPTTKYSSFENEKAVDTLKQNYHGDIEGGEVRMLGGRTAKKFTSASFVKMPSTVDDSTTEDQYIIHAVKILEQVPATITTEEIEFSLRCWQCHIELIFSLCACWPSAGQVPHQHVYNGERVVHGKGPSTF